MIKKSTSWCVLIYGIVLILLGFWGYQEGSQVSLYAGAGFGALLIISSLLMFAGWKVGSYIALAITLALTVVFAIRYSATGKSVPAIMAVLSGAMLLFLLAKLARWRK